MLNDFQLLQADDVFFSIPFLLRPKFGVCVSKLPRNNTAFWNLFSGHVFFLGFLLVETVLLKLENGGVEVEGAWRRRGASCRCNRHRFWVRTIHYLILEASDRVVEKFSASDEAWRFGTPNQKQIFWPRKGNRKR